ncbi:probable leucine-rich repeat receptor-like serine/threonine-protein kinase At3g14840 [Carica papaya]|uniref:probable leucine-rich repeat receptor-like serine/threonine-protein kinase At3g14840 n=1 Tax=Carica papaya TaxID=3649 RepID=UPI000B8CF331|nr:probable leucine-rich repeat receptor-like serine/threonine-protein kinase At3g14840 [Carica papaya]
MAPEYAMRGHLTDKADVYSFGVVALEIVSGRSNTSHRQKQDAFYLLDWAQSLKEEGKLMELVDPRLGTDFNKKEVMVMINVAFLCTSHVTVARPSMSLVVSMLEGKAAINELASDSSLSNSQVNAEIMKKHYQQLDLTETHSISTVGPWSASSTSAADLYPVNLDSGYFKDRE